MPLVHGRMAGRAAGVRAGPCDEVRPCGLLAMPGPSPERMRGAVPRWDQRHRDGTDDVLLPTVPWRLSGLPRSIEAVACGASICSCKVVAARSCQKRQLPWRHTMARVTDCQLMDYFNSFSVMQGLHAQLVCVRGVASLARVWRVQS